MKPSHNSSIRIIGGLWRGRKIPVLDEITLRPSTDRIRETLFNWLMPSIQNANCLDLFSGTGVLGFEALSRGAKQATLIENNPRVIQHLQQQTKLLNATAVDIVHADVLQWLAHPAPHTYDIIFVDPPFSADLWSSTCELLTRFNWLTDQTLVYIEYPTSIIFHLPLPWQAIKQQRAGNVCYGLWKY